MIKKNTSEQILKDYQAKSEAILQNMIQIVIRAQRKVDDEAYRKVFEKLEGKKYG